MIKQSYNRKEDVMERETLKNGADISHKCPCSDGSGYVILARKRISYNPPNYEFITWITDNKMNCFHGNYFMDIEKARQDFWKRVDRYCK